MVEPYRPLMLTAGPPEGVSEARFILEGGIASALGRGEAIRTGGVPRPFIIPWPRATDSFGIAFPAGTVGWCNSYKRFSSPVVTDYITDLNAFVVDSCIAIPSALPPGYTARLTRDFFNGNPIGDSSQFTHNSSRGFDFKMRTADGYSTTQWGPVGCRGGNTAAPNYFSEVENIFGNTSYVGNPHPGFRNLRLRSITINGGGSLDTLTGGAFTLTISHNADGTPPPLLSPGDTTDWTHTFLYTDFPATSNTSGQWTSSLVVNTGPILPTLGTLSVFSLLVTATSLTSLSPSGAPAFQLLFGGSSVRVDIPFLSTATGDGGLVAAGGSVT